MHVIVGPVANKRRKRDLFVSEETAFGCIRPHRRGLDFHERRSIEREPVAERGIQLEELSIALEQHYLLLNAFFIRQLVDFLTKVDESRTLLRANSLLLQTQRFLYERHSSSASVAARRCFSKINNNTKSFKETIEVRK